ncbi:MAG: S-methyl-5'-thioadenosine phosphorylase [Acidimicrobiia bacterium]|nr:S-methyl-5'-thioadenosine phosphorylase [Acidimicrobiia bacterium]
MPESPGGVSSQSARGAPRADIGVFGGSGFESYLADAEEIELETPYGPPAAPVKIATLHGKKVAFVPRHGREHEFAPHRVPYRANVWAMKALGVRKLVGPCAAGSLQHHVEPGSFVVCDQLVDRTKGRADTLFDGPPVTHVSFADPYCPDLRPRAVAACREAGVTAHESGTVVVIEGPRFSTRAESAWYSGQGWEVINMTQHPEAVLAREAEMCYVNISLITDFDAGFGEDSGIEPVTVDEILAVFRTNNEHLADVLEALIRDLPADPPVCTCNTATQGAQV